ncbi:MAG: histidine kinase [Acidobacteria bacterium]|nr:histidine kinase [Acidobacteriota bacterium]
MLRECLRHSRALHDLAVEQRDLPVIQGDPVRLSSLFSHLVANAARFRSETGPLLRVWAEPCGPGWTFCLEDNGIGLDPAAADRLFQPLTRLSDERHAGAGMGLAICRRIVDLHGGRIWLERAEPGRGAQFRFSLPG